MDAVSFINQHANIERVMNHYGFDRMTYEHNAIRACCKIHGGDNPSSFYADSETNLWFCHTECGGGDMFTLVQRMDKCSFPQAVSHVASILGIDITDMSIAERRGAHEKEIRSFINTMKRMKKNPLHAPFTLGVESKRVTKYRAFKEETLAHFDLRYIKELSATSKNGKPFKVVERLCVPISQHGTIIGYSLRKTKEDFLPKWIHIPAGINASETLYNMDRYAGQEQIVVVEGMFDVWAYHEIGVFAVCTYGAHLSTHQYKLLLRSGATTIVLSYDGDKAGREAANKAHAALRGKVRVLEVPLLEGEDPEKIERSVLHERFLSRKHK
jgi:DNA primase